jgi:NAD(P)-dependent dehydrogenase (short-subunit alcohol dehydrogenase family)
MTSVSIVTGGAGAMGSACARVLGSTVDVLLLTDRDEHRLACEAERIGAETAAAIVTVVGDIADPAVVEAVVRRAAALGELHAVVQTAGLSPSMASWQEILRVDLTGVAMLLDALLDNVVAGSTAVCLASISGHMGTFAPDMDAVLDAPLHAGFADRYRAQVGDEPDSGSTYRLAKRGVIRLCERAAVTWGARGGRVVSLSPGLIDTEMGRLELVNHPIKEYMARVTPIRSSRSSGETVLPGAAADIADAVAFLCSEQASFISGCDIRVDGGVVAAMNQTI